MRALALLLLTAPLFAADPCSYPPGSIGRRYFSAVNCPAPMAQQASVPSTVPATVWTRYTRLLRELPGTVRESHWLLPETVIPSLLPQLEHEVLLRRRLEAQQISNSSALHRVIGQVRSLDIRSAGW